MMLIDKNMCFVISDCIKKMYINAFIISIIRRVLTCNVRFFKIEFVLYLFGQRKSDRFWGALF